MNHNDCEVQTLALELVGSFARVQETIELVAKFYFEKRTPQLAAFVKHKALRNMRDEDRVKVVKALALDLDVDISVDTFSTTFKNIKAHRDSIAHSARFTAENRDTLVVEKSGWLNVDGSCETVKLSRVELLQGIQHCGWLRHSVMYLMSESDLVSKIMHAGQAATITRPPLSPDDWTGELVASV